MMLFEATDFQVHVFCSADVNNIIRSNLSNICITNHLTSFLIRLAKVKHWFLLKYNYF
jgi:hypothetical protein